MHVRLEGVVKQRSYYTSFTLSGHIHCTCRITSDRNEIGAQELLYHSTALVEVAKSLVPSNGIMVGLLVIKP